MIAFPAGTRVWIAGGATDMRGGMNSLALKVQQGLGRDPLFAGSERGGQRAAFMYSLIGTAKLNGIDPQAWLADVIARISDLPVSRLPELLPWNWCNPANLRIAA